MKIFKISKFHFLLYSFFLTLFFEPLLSVAPSSTEIQKNEGKIQQKDKKNINEDENILSNILDQIKDIDVILEHVGQTINQEKVYISQPKELIEKIMYLRKDLHIIINKPYPTHLTNDDIFVLLHFCRGLVNHISHSISSDLTQLPTCNVQEWIPPKSKTTISYDDLLKENEKNKAAIEKLKKQAEEVGLSKWHKVARFLDDKKIITNAAKGVLVATILAATIMYIDSEFPLFKKINFLRKTKEVVGDMPLQSDIGTPIRMAKGTFGKTVEAAQDMGLIRFRSALFSISPLSLLFSPLQKDL